MGPDCNLRGARRKLFKTGALFLARLSAREPAELDAEISEPCGKFGVMLLAQDLRRRHDSDLVAILDCLQRRQRSDHRLAAADVSLQQALHWIRLGEIV